MREFAEHLSLKDLSLRTSQAYYRKLRLIDEHFGKNPKQRTQAQLKSYIIHLKQEKGWAPSTIRQSIACCRMFYCDMLGKQWKLWDVVKCRDKKRLPVVLTMDEVAEIFENVALLRHKVPLRLAYCCGLRLDELVHLTIDDVEPTYVIVRDGKGGKDRHVPLSDAMYQNLRQYWKMHRNPKWIFPSPGRGSFADAKLCMRKSKIPLGKGSLRKALREAVTKSSIRKKTTMHTFRHSYATHLLALGVNIRQLQLYMGHEDIKTTILYTHLIPFSEEKSMEHIDAIAQMTF